MNVSLKLAFYSIIPVLMAGCGGAANVQQSTLVGISGHPVLNPNVIGTKSSQITFANNTASVAQTVTDVNGYLDSPGTDWSLLSNKIIGYNDSFIAMVRRVDSTTYWSSDMTGTIVTPELWDHPSLKLESPRGSSLRPTNSQIQLIVNKARDAGALTAWTQGWTGEGVTIGFNDGEILELTGREREYYSTANYIDILQAKVIAPNTTNAGYVGFMSSDIILLSDEVLAFSRTSGTWGQSDRRNYNFGLGVAAGIGALVMQKFPNANDNAVGVQVTASNGSVSQGLTPISGIQ
jgi:hypothetical protein